MSSGAWTPSPPPSIIAGPPIPMFEPSVAMTTSQHPSRAALPAKHRPEVIPTSGTCPLKPGEEVERHRVEAGHTGGVGVAGTAAAPFGEEHDGQALALGQLEQAVLLAVVLEALGAGQDRVVVRRHDDGSAVDPSDAADQPVGRGPGDEVLDVAPPALGGDGQRGELHEAARVKEVLDVLAGGALAGAAPALDRIGAGRVVAPARGARARRRGRPARRWRPRGRPPRPRPPPGSCRTSTSPEPTASPAVTSTSSTTPSSSAVTRCSIFMDSMTTSRAPAGTGSPAATRTSTTRPWSGEVTSLMPGRPSHTGRRPGPRHRPDRAAGGPR